MTIATKPEIYRNAGIELEPGEDWPGFAQSVLGSEDEIIIHSERQSRYLGLGVYIGQLAVREGGSTDGNIVHVLCERFIETLDPQPSKRHMDEEEEMIRRGIQIGSNIEMILAGEQ